MQIIRINSNDSSVWRDQIEELLKKTMDINFPDYVIDGDYATKKCDELDTYLKDNKAFVFVAVEGNVLLGWVWIHPIKRFNKERIHISEIAVAYEYRKMGIGRQLLEAVEKFAIENNYSELDLMVTVTNEPALAFYEKASFVPERFLLNKHL